MLFLFQKYCYLHKLKKYNIILPHEKSDYKHERDFYSSIDIMKKEVSYSSIGLGIELAFAYDSHVPLYLFYKSGKSYSKSLEVLTKNIIEYKSKDDLLDKIKEVIKE